MTKNKLLDIIDELPLCKEVYKYVSDGEYRFHTPGHKGVDSVLNEIVNLKWDVTEVGKMDNILNPTGCILESFELARKAFNSLDTYYVTVGASVCNLIALYAVKDFGRVAILRTSHTSVYNGLRITNNEPYIINDVDELGRNKPITLELLMEAIENEQVKTLLITRPNYYGMACDISAISKELNARGKYLIVDEAHGSHFNFSKLFPVAASKYADIYIDSAHKTLPVLTGGAFVSVNCEELRERVKSAYRMFHTTSPSYLSLCSLEYAAYVAPKLESDYERLKVDVDKMKEILLEGGVSLQESDDFTRLVIDCSRSMVSAKEVESRLFEKKIYAEFADSARCVFIITFEDSYEKLEYLARSIIECIADSTMYEARFEVLPPCGTRVMRYTYAVQEETEVIDFDEAENRICAANFGIYPPAAPVCVAGEMITEEIIAFMKKPLTFFGLRDGKVLVVKELDRN